MLLLVSAQIKLGGKMKTSIALIILMAKMSAFAGDLVSLTTGSPWPILRMNKMTISTDGIVTTLSRVGDEREEKEVALLSDDRLAALKEQVAKLTPEDLVNPTADQPMCYDAPTTTILATLPSGEEMKLFQRIGCQDHILQSWTNGPIADRVKAILEGFISLSRL